MNIRRAPFELRRRPTSSRKIERIVLALARGAPALRRGGAVPLRRASLADAMFAPVATRFRTYGVPLDDVTSAYVQTIYDLPAMREWIDAAKASRGHQATRTSGRPVRESERRVSSPLARAARGTAVIARALARHRARRRACGARAGMRRSFV